MEDSRDMRATRTTSPWAGWVVFAGVMAVIAGFFNIIQGLVAGVVIAGVNAITQLGFLAAYPVWSILIIALDVVVIYALIVHGREMADR
jgi:hypothetical protein